MPAFYFVLISKITLKRNQDLNTRPQGYEYFKLGAMLKEARFIKA